MFGQILNEGEETPLGVEAGVRPQLLVRLQGLLYDLVEKSAFLEGSFCQKDLKCINQWQKLKQMAYN